MKFTQKQEILISKILDESLSEIEQGLLSDYLAGEPDFADQLIRYLAANQMLEELYEGEEYSRGSENAPLDDDEASLPDEMVWASPALQNTPQVRRFASPEKIPLHKKMSFILGVFACISLIMVSVLSYNLSSLSTNPSEIAAIPTIEVPPDPTIDQSEKQTIPPPINPMTAQIVRTSGIIWETPSERFYEWEQVSVGRTLRFLKGSIEVVFSQGVHVILEGPAEMTIDGPLSVNVKQGRVMARVGKEGLGFTVNTPTGRIVDQGTEFGVDINPEKGVKVVVFDGKVDVFPDPNKTSVMVRIQQGEALSIKKTGDIAPAKMVEAGHFLPAAQPRFQNYSQGSTRAILSVTDNIRDSGASKFYEIVHGGFREDVLAYVDRLHEWNGIDGNGLPNILLGGDYIRTFNNDRLLEDYQMTVEVGVPARFYVLLDRRSNIPDWLQNDFVKTTMLVGLDEVWSRYTDSHIEHLKRSTGARTDEELDALFNNSPSVQRGSGPGVSIDNRFNVWVKELPQPGKVTLGALNSGARGNNHYGIVVVPY